MIVSLIKKRIVIRLENWKRDDDFVLILYHF
jgi:hypothetical protein